MEFIQLTILSLIQGITEFLPISSSAHLILTSSLLNWPDQGLTVDIFAHFGTLLAVIFYFRRDIKEIVTKFDISNINNLGFCLIIATAPVAIIGLISKDFISGNLRSEEVIIWTTVIFALFLILSEKLSNQEKDIESISWKQALIIGSFQVFALVPGSSRSAVTMAAALFLGFSKSTSARFSFLLAIPTLSLVFINEVIDISLLENKYSFGELFYVSFISFISATFCIHYFLKLIEKIGFLPFVIYRFFLAGFLIIF
ncbi:MAG: undecaprenyl-diphosphate phosphatase [Flavobacteriaceae bacterium]|jgi:undecaprenyl-diphosphatase|nr:undecaprenyl-diphosphate phosphatase [Flavobacteriaceae bacterium]|tara:strand:+ start:18129 stop:18899 length:771 start_codon:yes stop_codon:yes gene_type:complete